MEGLARQTDCTASWEKKPISGPLQGPPATFIHKGSYLLPASGVISTSLHMKAASQHEMARKEVSGGNRL